jgi:hypothetical protein
MRATDKSGVPKEAQDNGLSAGMSYGRQTPPRRPSGRNGDVSHAQGIFPDKKKMETIDLETVVKIDDGRHSQSLK